MMFKSVLILEESFQEVDHDFFFLLPNYHNLSFQFLLSVGIVHF